MIENYILFNLKSYLEVIGGFSDENTQLNKIIGFSFNYFFKLIIMFRENTFPLILIISQKPCTPFIMLYDNLQANRYFEKFST